MNILFVASEVDPLAKTGGLADVTGALAKALAGGGHDVRIVMPLYRQVDRARWGLEPMGMHFAVGLGAAVRQMRVWEGRLAAGSARLYLLEQPALFDRDGLYQARGVDYPDNLERFSSLSQAALALLPQLGWQPQVIHCHDWQTALVCAHRRFGQAARDETLAATATVLTVHNLAYQGVFPKEQWAMTQLPEAAFQIDGLEFYGQLNCLKGGLVSSDLITTVSPSYAQEIQTREWGCGLEGVLSARRSDLVGILNGIDPDEWNPQTDPHIQTKFSPEATAGKALCKQALQRSQGLPEQHELLIGMVQRLAAQKGIDIFLEALEALMALPLQIVILGSGQARYHEQLQAAAA